MNQIRYLQTRRSVSYVGILIFLLYSCSTVAVTTPPTETEILYLKTIRKFTLYFPQRIEVEMVRAGIENSISNPPFIRNNDTLRLETAYSKSITSAFTQYGNSKIAYVASDRISFVGEEETEKERAKILESIGVDSRIEINAKVKLDYPTRVPDLGIGNILYLPLILDLWWIDLAGYWKVEHTLEFSVTDVKTGTVKYKSPPVTKGKSTRTFLLSNLSPAEFSEALEQSTEEIILTALGKK
ncbi:MAG: hypothetical protein IPL26_09815 [Leptospiraceae bacterium]|nr:hypothetical protein [Leptospiraceae bacterium]